MEEIEAKEWRMDEITKQYFFKNYKKYIRYKPVYLITQFP